MYPVEVVKSVVWKNTVTGKTASIYGAVPWVSGSKPPEWEIVQTGWTLAMANGTIGYGRVPLATKEEAEAYMDKWLTRIGRKAA